MDVFRDLGKVPEISDVLIIFRTVLKKLVNWMLTIGSNNFILLNPHLTSSFNRQKNQISYDRQVEEPSSSPIPVTGISKTALFFWIVALTFPFYVPHIHRIKLGKWQLHDWCEEATRDFVKTSFNLIKHAFVFWGGITGWFRSPPWLPTENVLDLQTVSFTRSFKNGGV